jgi:hypothetical protein
MGKLVSYQGDGSQTEFKESVKSCLSAAAGNVNNKIMAII